MEDSLLNEPNNSKVIKENLQWVQLEKRPSMAEMMGREDAESEIFIPGSGVAKQLYEKW